MPGKLFHSVGCPYCKPIFYLVTETKVDLELVHIDLGKQENKTPEYLAINPFGKVPAIKEEDGFILFESSTLMRYVANSRDVADHWYPKDPKKRSQVDLFQDLFQGLTKFFSRFFTERNPVLPNRFKGQKGDALADLEETLTDINHIFLKNRTFLAADEISIADLQLIFWFGQLELTDYDLGAKFPKVQAWKDAVLATPIKTNYEEYLGQLKARIAKAHAEADAKAQAEAESKAHAEAEAKKE